jgi:hypothetical protein
LAAAAPARPERGGARRRDGVPSAAAGTNGGDAMTTDAERLRAAAKAGRAMILDADDMRTVIQPSREVMTEVLANDDSIIVTSVIRWALIETLLPITLRELIVAHLSKPMDMGNLIIVRELPVRVLDQQQRDALLDAYCTVVPYVTRVESPDPDE